MAGHFLSSAERTCGTCFAGSREKAEPRVKILLTFLYLNAPPCCLAQTCSVAFEKKKEPSSLQIGTRVPVCHSLQLNCIVTHVRVKLPIAIESQFSRDSLALRL